MHREENFATMRETIQSIAHQWRQPLSQINSIVGFIDRVLHEKNIRESILEEKLKEIEILTKYMSNTIDDFAIIFEQTAVKKEFFVKDVIKIAIGVVELTLKSHEITIIKDIEKNFYCNSYENELKQVLIVLLNNAKDALLQRNIYAPQISVSLLSEENNVVIKVCDNGGGIPKSVKEKLFNPSFTTKHTSEGSGIGLHMARKIMQEQLEGNLTAKNEGEGVCFFITIPRGVSNE